MLSVRALNGHRLAGAGFQDAGHLIQKGTASGLISAFAVVEQGLYRWSDFHTASSSGDLRILGWPGWQQAPSNKARAINSRR